MNGTATTATPATFTVGQTVTAQSFGDSNCVWTFTVIKRTAKFVTLEEEDGTVRRVGVSTGRTGAEIAFPFGHFSMAPIVQAG